MDWNEYPYYQPDQRASQSLITLTIVNSTSKTVYLSDKSSVPFSDEVKVDTNEFINVEMFYNPMAQVAYLSVNSMS